MAQPPLTLHSDYAFGEQARHILQSLILLFGHHVRYVNVMGKAGALIGKRGDILFPSHLIFEASTVRTFLTQYGFLLGVDFDRKLTWVVPG